MDRRAFDPASVHQPNFSVLESRLLFSATPIDPGMVADPAVAADAEPVMVESATAEAQSATDNAAVTAIDATEQSARELVFIDEAVPNIQQMLDDLRESRPAVEVFVLDGAGDGVNQITAALAGRTDVASIHIVSHSEDSRVKLGSVWLGESNLDGWAGQIASWQSAITADADILFYGCDLASDRSGQTLIDSISALTAADVAASNDDTGHASYGGDWNLEYSTGAIETDVAFSTELQETWVGKLATITVDTFDDIDDSGDAYTSFREAIYAASGGDTILLASGTYNVTLDTFTINGDVTITGFDARSTIIDATGLGKQVFRFNGNSVVTMSQLTIQGGNENNGGGIYVANASKLYLSDAILQNNTSDMGGAIHVHGEAYLDSVLLYNNTATSEGGAIHFHGAAGGSLTNVTISGNDAPFAGGVYTDSDITITNSTITLNEGSSHTGGVFNDGAIVNISNTIVSGNTAGNSFKDVRGAFNSDGSNLIEVLHTATGFGSDITGVSANLFALGDRGGQTDTHALIAGSPAINNGTAAGAPLVDQRGVARVGNVDIGAYEATTNILVVTNTSDFDNATDSSTVATLLANPGADGISLREAIRATNGTPGLDEIYFQITSPLTGGEHLILASASLPTITGPVIIDGTTDSDFTGTPIIRIDGDFAFGAANGLVLGAGSDGSTIRGLAITGFDDASGGNAIIINSDNNLVVGNYIGVKTAASVTDPNRTAIDISGGANNTIGGTSPEDRNVIASNLYAAVAIHGSTATNNQVLGNYIGVAADGSSVIGGYYGIVLWDNADNNQIGGTASDAGNRIAGYDRGVYLAGNDANSPMNVSILGNQIYQSDILGIALSNDGVTPNGTAGPGPNQYQNYPVLDSAITDGTAAITIDGTLSGTALADYRIEFFASSSGHASGHGEAETYLGFVDVTADTLGVASFSKNLAALVPVGYKITATATDSAGNTSEFAQNIDASIQTVTVTARETVDADADGQIDHIKITTSENLNDDFSGLNVSVTGYTLDATTPYLTNIGAGGTNDNVYYVMLQEGGTPDTGATPLIQVLANTTLARFGGGGTVELDSSAVAATDRAAAVLISATSPQVIGTSIFQSVGQQLELVFSETLSGLPSEVDLESALTFAGGAVDGDNLPSIGTGVDPYSLVTTAQTNDTIRITLNANNTFNASGLIVGTHNVQVIDGSNLTDATGNSANATASAVTISGDLNDEPTLLAVATNPTFTENSSTVTLFSGSSASTIEAGQTLAELTLTISNVSDGADEVLGADGSAIALTNGNSGTTATNGLSFNVSVAAGTATVSLSGGALSEAETETLVNGLSYQNNSDDPNTANRMVTLTELKDSGGTGGGGDDTATLSIASTIAVTSLNDEPTLSATGTNPTFAENGLAVALYSGASASTIEAGQTLSGLTLTITNVSDGADEILGADGAAIALSNGNSGTTATNGLTFNVSVAAGTATVSLSGGALSAAETETLVNGLSYQNNSDDPNTANRVVTLTELKDSGGTGGGGDDTATLSIASTVTMTSLNNEPTLTAVASDPTFTENGSAVGLFSSSSASTIEAGQTLTELTLTISNVSDGADEILGADGSSIALTNGNSGTSATNGLSFNVSVAAGTATVSLSGGALSAAETQTLVNGLTYENHSDDPSTPSRVVTLTELKDSGGTGGGGDDTATLNIASTVTITALNDEPTLTAVASDPTFTENGPAVSLFSSSSASTIEAGQTLAELTLTISNVSDGADEILGADGSAIALTNGNSGTTTTNGLTFNVSVAAGTATVSFSGGALSAAEIETLVNGLSYQNDSDNPNTSNRVVTLTELKDSGGTVGGGDDTATLSIPSTVTVNTSNDAPTDITLDNLTVDENDAGAVIGNLGVADADTGDTHTWSVNDARFEIVGTQLKLKTTESLNKEAEPTVNLTITVIDQGGAGVAFNKLLTITVNDVNEAPVADAETYTVLNGGLLNTVAPGVLQGDVDPEGDPFTARLLVDVTDGTLILNPDGSFTYTPDPGFNGTDTFTYEAWDGSLSSAATVVTINVNGIPLPTPSPPLPDPDPAPEPDPEPDPEPEPDETGDESEEGGESSGSTPPSGDGSGSVIAPISSPGGSGRVETTGVSDEGSTTSQIDIDSGLVFEAGPDLRSDRDNSQRSDESIQNQSSLVEIPIASISSIDQALMLSPGLMWNELDQQLTQVESQIQGDLIVVGAAGAAASSFTVGVVAWAIRTGFLASGLLAQMPAWRAFDPLLVMRGLGGDDDDETLQEMMNRRIQTLDGEQAVSHSD